MTWDTREEDGALWETLLRGFGPRRRELGLYPEVAHANAFIGFSSRPCSFSKGAR